MAHTSPGCCCETAGLDRGWHAKYIRCRSNYRAAKATIRQQATKSRQLIAAVTDQLQLKDEEIKKLRANHDRDLNAICQQLLFVHGSLLRERERVVAVVQEKDRVIQQQRIEIERFRGSGVTISGPVMGVGLDRVRPGSGSIRQHGSFRQYKKDKIRQRNYNSSSESNLSSSTGWNGSSEESSESSPRQTRPPLRLTLSSGSVESNSALHSEQKERPRKGILKTSSSYGNLSNSSSSILGSSSYSSSSPYPGLNSDVLENLQNLLRANKDFTAPSIVKSLLVVDCSVKKEERSDSGRESEDQSSSSLENSFCRLSSISSSSSSSGIVTDSPNSSFDASDPTTKVVIEIRGKSKPPAPPPRSSTTRLSSDVIPTDHGLITRPATIHAGSPTDPIRRASAGDALDCLIYDKNSNDDFKKIPTTPIRSGDPPIRPPKSFQSKKVKFHPEVECKSTTVHNNNNDNPQTVKPLDPNFLHFLPPPVKSTIKTTGSEKQGISYYEPYL